MAGIFALGLAWGPLPYLSKPTARGPALLSITSTPEYVVIRSQLCVTSTAS